LSRLAAALKRVYVAKESEGRLISQRARAHTHTTYHITATISH
jgi:hypothetical protein